MILYDTHKVVSRTPCKYQVQMFKSLLQDGTHFHKSHSVKGYDFKLFRSLWEYERSPSTPLHMSVLREVVDMQDSQIL